MLHDPLSHGLWEKTAPSPPVTTALNDRISADVIIVGGGYTGFSCALHLAQAGTHVAVLEAREIGFGGAGRNVGLINAGMWVMPDDVSAALGPMHGERLLELLGQGPRDVMALIEQHDMACELEKNGTLHCAVGDKGLREIEARAAQWQARGAPVELLDARETEKRVGSHAYSGSLWDRRAGTLQPLAYARGLAQAALQAGVQIYTNSPVIGTQKKGQRWTVKTPQGGVIGDWIVVATDAYSFGPWEKVRTEQVHLPYFNLATAPLSESALTSILPGREGVWDTKNILSSFRRDQSGRLVFGSVGALRWGGLNTHQSWSRRALARLFPQLDKVDFDYSWYGKIGMTDNALPRFHRFAPQVIGFSGYNGRGIAPGTVFGRTLATHILGKLPESDLPLPLSDPRDASFRVARELWYEAGAQLAHAADARF